MKFPIRFDRWYRTLSQIALLPPSRSYVELDGGDVEVRMGWAFRARFPRTAVRQAGPPPMRVVSRGVHGWRGAWLVNGSGDGLLALELDPPQRARVMGVAVALRRLIVSVDDPFALAQQLRGA